MSYKNWFEEHSNKHKQLINKLKNKTVDEIIAYFDFDNMKKNEPDFCFLYKENKKCHEIENLNCYLCACPNFRFNDNGLKKIDEKTLFSYCSFNSKFSKEFVFENSVHQDCSDCLIPHKTKFIKNNFNQEWTTIMKECEIIS